VGAGAVTAATAAGCGGATAGTGDGNGNDASLTSDAGGGGDDGGITIAPPYGHFPPDRDAFADDDSGQVIAAYGGAVIIDSGGSDDAGEAHDAAAHDASTDAAADAEADSGHTILPPYGIAPAYGHPAPPHGGFPANEVPTETPPAPVKENSN
jgi:hypothetical protein